MNTQTWEWRDEPKPDDPRACWCCHGSGEGDCSRQGACGRCWGYGVEPEPMRHDGHWHWGYGGSSTEEPVELGRELFVPVQSRKPAKVRSR